MRNRRLYSRVTPGRLLAIISYFDNVVIRHDLVHPDSLLQVAIIPMDKGSSVAPHRHLDVERNTVGTQEVWVVVRGGINVRVYDLDDSPIEVFKLSEKDIFVALAGGHEILSSDSNTILYEIKNGPYLGEALDRIRI
jgi:cupin fold WbuC family metalloprotein